MVGYRRACLRGRSMGSDRPCQRGPAAAGGGSGGKGTDGGLRRPAAQSAAATTDRRTAVRGAQLGAGRTARRAVTSGRGSLAAVSLPFRGPSEGTRRRGEPVPCPWQRHLSDPRRRPAGWFQDRCPARRSHRCDVCCRRTASVDAAVQPHWSGRRRSSRLRAERLRDAPFGAVCGGRRPRRRGDRPPKRSAGRSSCRVDAAGEHFSRVDVLQRTIEFSNRDARRNAHVRFNAVGFRAPAFTATGGESRVVGKARHGTRLEQEVRLVRVLNIRRAWTIVLALSLWGVPVQRDATAQSARQIETSPSSTAPAPKSGSMPQGRAPRGKLGTEPKARGRLGTDPTPAAAKSRPPRPG